METLYQHPPKSIQSSLTSFFSFFVCVLISFGASLMQHFLLWFLMSARNLMYDSRLGLKLSSARFSLLSSFVFCRSFFFFSFFLLSAMLQESFLKPWLKVRAAAPPAVNGDHQRPSYPISRPPNSSLDGKIAHSTAIRCRRHLRVYQNAEQQVLLQNILQVFWLEEKNTFDKNLIGIGRNEHLEFYVRDKWKWTARNFNFRLQRKTRFCWVGPKHMIADRRKKG